MSPLLKKARSLSAEFAKAASKVEQDISPKGVHRLRTTIRRLETLVSYAQPALSKKQEKTLEEMGDLRKRAGRVRDLDIQLGLLNGVANGSTAADRRTVLEALKTKRERQASRLSSAVKKLSKPKFFQRLDKIVQKSETNGQPDAEAAPLEKARAELLSLAATPLARQPLKPRRLHELRIALKNIRYTAELAAKSPEQAQFLADLKAVQDSIGDWHDWETLLKTSEKQFQDRVNCALLVEMRALFNSKFSTAASAVVRLLSTPPVSAALPRKQPRSAASPQALAQRA